MLWSASKMAQRKESLPEAMQLYNRLIAVRKRVAAASENWVVDWHLQVSICGVCVHYQRKVQHTTEYVEPWPRWLIGRSRG